MHLRPLEIPGLLLVETPPFTDNRGAFVRVHCNDSFAAAGVGVHWTQSSLATNPRRGTLRGLHFQRPPGAETKMVRCISGRVYDVVVDLRHDSPCLGRWIAVELEGPVGPGLLIPAGCAHGYQTLKDDSHMLYLTDAPYQPGLADGLRWNDPGLAIAWPEPPTALSDRDATWPNWNGRCFA